MAKDTEKAYIVGLVEQSIMVNGNTEKKTVKELFTLRMGMFTTGNGKTAKEMVKVFILTQMEINMLEAI